MNFFENITFRKQQRHSTTEISFDGANANSTTVDGSTSSLPNISADENTLLIQQLKIQIEDLTSKLNSAHEEINNLSLENGDLKNRLSEVTSKNDVLKKTTFKLTNEITPRKNSRASTPRSCSHKNKPPKQQSQQTDNQTTEQIRSTSTLSKQKTTLICESARPSQNTSVQKEKPEISDMEIRKNQICIISSNKNNDVLSIAEETFKFSQVCHYVTPNCGTIQLIRNLDQKVKDFSMDDYCIVLIGEEDFKRTENYVEIVVALRNELQKIRHTNVILCVPTFKLSNYSTMFNWRIETFNSLLDLDLQCHNYAMVLDSNLDLLYDFTMFSKYDRKLNNLGMKNVFDNLLLLVNNNKAVQPQDNVIDLNSNQFFL